MNWFLMALIAGLILPAQTHAGTPGAPAWTNVAGVVPDPRPGTGPKPESQPRPKPGSTSDSVSGSATVSDRDSGNAAGWRWPMSPRPSVVRPFEPPAQRWSAGHRGVDIAATTGAEVLAPADGVVAFVGRVAGRPVLSLRHEGGLRSTYEPVVGVVSVGTAVHAGDVVGHLSHDPGHCAPAVCLHWGALRGRAYLDPLRLIDRRPIILLPVP